MPAVTLVLLVVPLGALGVLAAVSRALPPRERAVLALGGVLLAASALLSPTAPVNDPWTHYLHLRAALAEPVRLLDLWDRPGFTLLAAGPAAFGLRAARLAAVVTALVAVAATMRAARGVGLARPWAAGLLMLAQYDFFGQGASTMTELPFAAALAIAVLGWAEDRPWVAAAGLGWAAISRPEGVAYAVAGAVAVAVRWRRAGPAAAVVVPLAAYAVAGAIAFADPAWMIAMNPYRGHVAARLDLARIAGSYFFTAVALSQGPALAVLEGIGVALALGGAARRLRFLVAPLAFTFVLLTFVRIGDTDAWRESRYLVAVAPALALLAAAALDALLARFPRLAPPALLAAAAWSGCRVVRYYWAEAGTALPAEASELALEALVVAAALWALRRRIAPAVAICAVLVATVAVLPPGALSRHRDAGAVLSGPGVRARAGLRWRRRSPWPSTPPGRRSGSAST